jgi:hypothetical protein
LEVGSNVWEIVMDQALKIFPDSNDEPLATAISFAFKAASRCQRLSTAVWVFLPSTYLFTSLPATF